MRRCFSVLTCGGLGRPLTRTFAASAQTPTNITHLSLLHPIPSGENQKPSPTNHFFEDAKTLITTLSNGLRVASQNKFGMQCALGVIVGAGPRYEVSTRSGVSHYLEKLGFHSSASFRDRDEVQSVMEDCNAIFDCQISRDFIIYAVSGINWHMDRLTHALSETVLRPRIAVEEVEMAKRSIMYELDALQRGPPVEPILSELLHAAAYGGTNTLGLPRYCPQENLGKINRDDIIRFMATYFRPERMVVVGVGVEHDAFVKSVERHFLSSECSFSSEPAAQNLPTPDASVAQYTGGSLKLERSLAQYHAPMPEFAHCAIGLESCSSNDPQFVAACLLNSLLGGGGSFSAGGPGKGMYTRLYLNVLNEYHWVNSAQAENNAYTDSGLFALSGSAEPPNLGRLVHTLVREIRHTAESPITAEELSRAKHQLESMLLMNLETRPVAFEDIARQVLSTGCRREPAYWVEQINKVTADELRDLVYRLLQSPPTLIGFGNVKWLPDREEIAQALAEPLGSAASTFTGRLPCMFKRFI